MILTNSPRHQRTVQKPSTRKRSLWLLAGGASLVALAGLGLALFSVQLGQDSASQGEALAGTSDTDSSDSASSGGVGDGEGGAENPDGRLRFGTKASDTQFAGISGLSPALLHALQEVTSDAEADGTSVMVNSGWRSAELQNELLQEAVVEYGSEAEAARWVASPETSLHVSGDAVDIEGYGAADWLATNGAKYGLCLMYLNEPWHFEFQATASVSGCAPQLADPTKDPRLQ